MAVLWLVLGLVALVGGAEVVVKFGTQFARRLHISPIIIGLTVVSIGTSAPELAVGIDAMLRSQGNLVLGNIVGTNIVNLFLILGLSAAIRPIIIRRSTLKLDLPAMIGASILLWLLTLNGFLYTWTGLVLIIPGAIYMWRVVATAKTREQVVVAEDDDPPPPPGVKWGLLEVALLVVGIAVIVVGADWLVSGAVAIATALGVSDTIIGLTIVAIGTSAPELATTIMATIRGKRAIAIGNLLGSSTLNLTFILGISLLFGPHAVAVDRSLITINLPIMVAVAVLCIPIFVSSKKISRWEGVLMVSSYLVYLTYLIISA
ncbi:MAG: calcium/sodium antiporter [Propionibacteriaceae bacterium]|jgi:cation:H+ antiporter|nr:calcium/sodium antiporter [Propionibacteriaceae bacterium]